MVSKEPVNCSLAVESRQAAVDKVCERILSEIKANNFSREDVFSAHLAMQEAFLNAIKHGNRMDPCKQVKIEYSVSPEKFEISIMDEGEGFEPESVPDPRHEENLYKTEGRGLLLMNSYMDVVEYVGRGNCVHMVRYNQKNRLKKA